VNIVESNVNKLVREVFSTFNETKTKQNIELRLILPPESELISVQTDPLRVRQIVTNLIGNALKFTEKGFVELGYNIKNGAVDQFLEFYVKDTGVGIPLDKQAIIFERFRQVDEATTRKYGGTGLGLAISKKLVGLLGGNIWVDSTPNEGSIFYFTLPYSKKVEVLGSDEPFHATKYNWKGRTILIAEDENSNYELIKASIYRTGIKIIRAHNGEEAVEHIERNNGIDLVLMDIRMPRMNGYEATRKIKSLKPGLPVISITAYAMSEDKAKSLEAGCDVYISKPIKPSRLLSLLNDFIPAS
jgi:CheY-like chemotaxis protein